MSQDYSSIITKAPDHMLLCIGDVMLDRFIYGAVERISPEAPVPVFRETGVREMPGGAANVARNVAAMGAKAALIGVCGDDKAAAQLRRAIESSGLSSDYLIEEKNRQTTVKSRYVSSSQQILRADVETSSAISSETEERIIKALEELAPKASAILISDYAKGCLTQNILTTITRIAGETGAPVIVDPKGDDYSKYGAVSVIKPNASELAQASGIAAGTDGDVEAALAALSGKCAAEMIVVTRAAKGMSVRERSGEVSHYHGQALEVYDVSGAGDTSLAALGLGLAVSGDIHSAIALALRASGLAVGKAGTTAVSAAEILSGPHAEYSLKSRDQVLRQASAWKKDGLIVGFTNGCFDILHVGHLRVLSEARRRCDRLIVGLNSDASVKRLKGASRPVNEEQARAAMLLALKSVDEVILFPEDTPAELLAALEPDLLVKGGDYEMKDIVGAAEIIARGGAVHIVPFLPGHSTTEIISKAQEPTSAS